MVVKIPKIGWAANGTWKPKVVRSPYIYLNLRVIYNFFFYFMNYFFRYWILFWRPKYKERLFIDVVRPLHIKPSFGVPCGGLGSGSIGTDFRGGFCKFTLRPGMVEYDAPTVAANQFIVTIREQNKTTFQKVLSGVPTNKYSHLKSWSFDFPAENIDYHGLYPRSWTTFRIPRRDIVLTCRQISPVFPNDYQDTCLPTTAFNWTVENNENKDISISIAFTFRNGTGDSRWDAEGECSGKQFSKDGCNGIALKHNIDGMQCTFGLAAKSKDNQKISTNSFNVEGSGEAVWNSLRDFGDLSSINSSISKNETYSQLGVAVCVQTLVGSGKQSEIDMCLSWDMPKVYFQGRRRNYFRRYTRWFGTEGNAAPELCKYALDKCPDWERKIEAWQNPILNNSKLPDWYKNALLNEVYYLCDGGSLWFEYEESWRIDEPHLSDYLVEQMKEYGRFAYLESYEYRMYNTYDVHFYASFIFAMLFPKIQQCLQTEFCDQINHEDPRKYRFFYNAKLGLVKRKLRIPHDLGTGGDDPWLRVNSYVMYDSGCWRDLNLKFIMTSMRDYQMLNEDKRFLKHMWPNVQALIEVGVKEWDLDGDGMIENSGTFDQTYDTWRMFGTSAYCGGLWLGALTVAIKMAEIFNEPAKVVEYKGILKRAQVAYEKKLWTGDYYKFDEHSSANTSIMSDHMCGYWFLSACDLHKDVLPKENVRKALKKIYDFNVCKFANGTMGAINGMMPDGRQDRTSFISDEVWTGATYAYAACLLREGMVEEAFVTARGVSKTNERFGLQYQSPEGWKEVRVYKAPGYMRPLSVWAMQWNIERYLKEKFQ